MPQAMTIQRVVVALLYAVGIVSATLQASGMPQTTEAWVGLALAAIMGFWAKFSSSQTVIAINRPPWTEAERSKAALDSLNKGL